MAFFRFSAYATLHGSWNLEDVIVGRLAETLLNAALLRRVNEMCRAA
jgi:hypothetical protein